MRRSARNRGHSPRAAQPAQGTLTLLQYRALLDAARGALQEVRWRRARTFFRARKAAPRPHVLARVIDELSCRRAQTWESRHTELKALEARMLSLCGDLAIAVTVRRAVLFGALPPAVTDCNLPWTEKCRLARPRRRHRLAARF